MSYLEMSRSPLPDMSKGIISFWFREIEKQAEPPAAEVWPQDFWSVDNAETVMVPPNAQYSATLDTDFKDSVLFWNSYGLANIPGIGGQIFGNLFLGPAAVWIPNPPPVVTNTMLPEGAAIGGIADVGMSQKGIRTLLTFGDPNIDYEYATWKKDDPGVIDAVKYIPQITNTVEFIVADWPPPYIPYLLKDLNTGQPIGKDGKLKVLNYKINPPTTKFKLAPSFIGIDGEGHLVINLQTNTKATYKGMSYQMDKVKELWANITYLNVRGPPYTYGEIGFPFPDGDWVMVKGYWNGYQYDYKDISQEIMGCAPESFVIYAATVGIADFASGAPTVKDGGWHHVLFSFDISGSVTADIADANTPAIATSCQAWLAFDDVSITGVNLQNRPPVHDGFLLPKLRGTQTTQILDCGPATAWGRSQAGLGPNDILPRNAWLHGWQGNPKDGLLWFTNNGGPLISEDDDERNSVARRWGGKVGDFNWLDWTGLIWPLYGHGVAPGPWQGTFDPMHPTVPDPKTLATPSYSASGFSIPCSGNPIGVPCTSGMNPNNTGVEMAELQIWANVSADVGGEAIRRLFIDKNGKPVKMKDAEKVLGKPDIRLHGSNNWKRGRNTGTTGVGDQGQVNPDGQFSPSGGIEKFKPDPKLDK